MVATEEQLQAYVRELFVTPDLVLEDLLQAASRQGLPQISIKAEEGRVLQLLLRSIGASKVLEIGTLGGYSAIWMARALPPDGRLISLERDPTHAAFARNWIKQAGVDEIVEVREGVALELLPTLRELAPFDAIFIDADKQSYPQYLDWALDNTRIGGLIIAHNAFLQGHIVKQPEADDNQLAGMRNFNERMAFDPRLLSTILFGGDGMAVGLVVA